MYCSAVGTVSTLDVWALVQLDHTCHHHHHLFVVHIRTWNFERTYWYMLQIWHKNCCAAVSKVSMHSFCWKSECVLKMTSVCLKSVLRWSSCICVSRKECYPLKKWYILSPLNKRICWKKCCCQWDLFRQFLPRSRNYCFTCKFYCIC